MEYTTLTVEQRRDMIRGHLLQAEADHFTHELNAEKAESAGNDEDAKTMRDLADKAAHDIETCRRRLDQVEAEFGKGSKAKSDG